MRKVVLLLGLGLLTLPVLAQVPQESVTLGVKPSKCVALHKGQKCYQKLKIQWGAETAGAYCLFVSHEQKPLQCWLRAKEGIVVYEYASNETQRFELKSKDSGRTLATTEIIYASVYKHKKKSFSGWRLF